MASRDAAPGRLRRAAGRLTAAGALALACVSAPAAGPADLCLPKPLAAAPHLEPGAPFDAWTWHRLETRPVEASAATLPDLSIPVGPVVPSALMVLRQAGLPAPVLRVAPRARSARVARPVQLTGTLAQRLDTLALAAAYDVRIAYHPDTGLLSVQQPPLAEVRVAAADGPLFAAALLEAAGADGLHFDGRPGRIVFGTTDADLVPAARSLRLAQSLTGRAVLDVRILALPPGASRLWGSLTRSAPRVHYAPEGAAALSWPYEDLPAASIARDRLLAVATDHTGRRLPLLPSFLTVVPFDPRRPCVSRSSAPLLPSLAPDLGIEWLPEATRLRLGVLPQPGETDPARWALARPLAVPIEAGAALAFRSGHTVLWAQLRPVPDPSGT